MQLFERRELTAVEHRPLLSAERAEYD